MSNAYFSVRRLISLKLQVLIFDGGITMLMSYVEFRATHLAGHIFLPYLTCGWINSACITVNTTRYGNQIVCSTYPAQLKWLVSSSRLEKK